MDINYMNTRSSSQNSRNSNSHLIAHSAGLQNSVHKTPLEVTDLTSDRTTSRDTTITTTVTMNNSAGTTLTDKTSTRIVTTIEDQSTNTNTTIISQTTNSL